MKIQRIIIEYDNGQRQVVESDATHAFEAEVNYSVDLPPGTNLRKGFMPLNFLPARLTAEVTGYFKVIQAPMPPDRVDLLPCRACGAPQGPLWLK